MIKKILVSQPQPTSEKSPYYDIAREFGVELTFRPFIKVEELTANLFPAAEDKPSRLYGCGLHLTPCH